jgi:phenylacetate-CoA ligase
MPIEDLLHPLLKHYLEAPRWLSASAGRAYALLPQGIRIGSAYSRFRNEIAQVQGATEVCRLASRKLESTLSWAIETVPAYQRYWPLLREAENPLQLLSHLPITSKLDIKRDPNHYLSDAMPTSKRLRMFTGGSTLNPMQFYLQRDLSRPKEYAFMQSFRERLGGGAKELTLSLRGRSVPSAARKGGCLWMLEPIKRQLVLSSDHLEERYMPQYAATLTEHKPAFIEAFPSALYPLARWLAEHPLPEFTAGLRGVMLFSENAYGFQMRLFREVFGCPVLAHYGHSERVLMAASMPDDDRYFFWPQYGWFELLDGAGKPVTQPGVLGHIVGTSFDNRVMPFVRYRTGDLGVLGERGHPDLPGYPVCERIEGRMQEFVVCRDHRLISIATIGAAHFPQLADSEAIQYEQRAPGEVTLKIVATQAPTAEQQRQIAAAFREKTQGGCDARVVRVDTIERTERGKRRMLVQHLDLSRYFGASVSGC